MDKLQEENDGIKKHNVAATSAQAFKEINASGQRGREKETVLGIIKVNQPVTSRQIVTLSGIERSSICRSLHDLVNESPALIKEAFVAKCQVTGKRVKHYTLIDWIQRKQLL